MNAKKTYIETHTYARSEERSLCTKMESNDRLKNPNQFKTHSLDGTCMFCSWFFWGLVFDCSKQQATAAAATNRTELNCGLLLFISSLFFCWYFVSHRLKTKYDRKCDLNEDNESVKWQISIRKRINECDNTKKTKKSVDKLTTVQQRFTSNSILFNKHLISPSVERPSPSIIIIGLFL